MADKTRILVFFFIGLTYATFGLTSGKCDSSNCTLPNCFCRGTEIPGSLSKTDTPQLILFNFEGPLVEKDEQRYSNLVKLFDGKRKNPNGCSISMTLFVADHQKLTDYSKVQALYIQGHEIAISTSVSSRTPKESWKIASKEKWEAEMEEQRNYLHKNGCIPLDDMKGMMGPDGLAGGDDQFQMLEENDFLYDVTISSGNFNVDQPSVWPYTMDFPPISCHRGVCPTGQYKGLWEISLVPWFNSKDRPCTFMDTCDTQPRTKGEAYELLMSNFKRHYENNRAPFLVNLHADVFRKKKFYMSAVMQFLDEMGKNPDVYIISATQAIEWMKNPVPLNKLKNSPGSLSCHSDRKPDDKCKPQKKKLATTPLISINGTTLVVLQYCAFAVALACLMIKERMEEEAKKR